MNKYFFINKIKSILLAVVVIASALSVSGCNDDYDDGSDHSFTYTLYQNPQNLDPQLATDKSSLMIIENMFLGLMTHNSEGNIDYGVASDYSISEDGLKYTFTLKDNCFWYSADGTKSVVTAHDFVYAFKRIFDPVTRSPYKEKFSFLQNAQAIIDGKEEYSKLGVYAVNNTELVFFLDRPHSEFLYLLTTAPAMPCNKNFFENTKARYGLDDESVISNGPFYMTQWSYDPYGSDNLIYMKRNSVNSESEKVYPYMLTFLIDRDNKAASENFNASLSECLVSENRDKKSIIDMNHSEEYEFSSVGMIFSNKYNISPELKKALSLNIDRESLKKIAPSDFNVAYGIVPHSLHVGDKEYRKNVPDNELPFYEYSYSIQNDEIKKFNSMSQDKMKILVREKSDYGLISKIAADWQERLNIYIGVEYADEDEFLSRLKSGDYFMALIELTTVDNSIYYYMKNIVAEIDMEKSVSEKVDAKLDEILSGNDVCSTVFDAENTLVSNGIYVPVFYRKLYLEYKKDMSDLIFDPFSRKINFRYSKYFD